MRKNQKAVEVGLDLVPASRMVKLSSTVGYASYVEHTMAPFTVLVY